MISGLVDGLFAALVALLVSAGLMLGPQHEAVTLGAPTAPTATPAAAPAGVGDASADYDGYMQQIITPLHDLRDSFDSMSTLMQAPYVTDDGWRNDAAAAFDGIQAAHKALAAIEPPAFLVEAHAALTAGTESAASTRMLGSFSPSEFSILLMCDWRATSGR